MKSGNAKAPRPTGPRRVTYGLSSNLRRSDLEVLADFFGFYDVNEFATFAAGQEVKKLGKVG